MRKANNVIPLSVLFILLPLCAPAKAQESNSQPRPRDSAARTPNTNVSELENGNLLRVAASASQVQEVLIKEPGILVELKRWVAKEASDNGQIVNDEDLTDTAIFARLKTDVGFRSVATRLVERYGYLRPSVNPDSAMGKEQELLIKERVRRLVQIEAQEDAESIKSSQPAASETKALPCDLNDDRQCVQGGASR